MTGLKFTPTFPRRDVRRFESRRYFYKRLFRSEIAQKLEEIGKIGERKTKEDVLFDFARYMESTYIRGVEERNPVSRARDRR